MDDPKTSDSLTKAGGLVFTALLDGSILALDDITLKTLKRIKVGVGIDAPPMTYEVDGKQYIAIATGLIGNRMGRIGRTPELRDLAKNTTMIFVFAL